MKRYELDGKQVTANDLKKRIRCDHGIAKEALEAGCTTMREVMVFVEKRRAKGRASSNRNGGNNRLKLEAVHKVGRAGE